MKHTVEALREKADADWTRAIAKTNAAFAKAYADYEKAIAKADVDWNRAFDKAWAKRSATTKAIAEADKASL